MTFSQILADVYRRCGFSSTPDTDVQTRIKAFVNEVQQDIMSEPGMEYLLNDQTTLSSVASQATYGLPFSVLKVKDQGFRDTTNRIILTPMSLGEYYETYPSPSVVTGTPRRFVDLGFSEVASQPSDASTLYVLSSSNSDTGTAYIEGLRSGGVPFSDSVTMTGQTAVAFPTFSDIVGITKFYVSATAVGSITLREDSGSGTVLSTIGIGKSTARYRRVALAPTPSAVLSYTIDFERQVTDMTVDTDDPVVPPQFHRLLAIGARAKEYEKQNQIQRWNVALGEYTKELKKLKFWVYSQTVGTPNMRGLTYKRDVVGDNGVIASSSSSSSSPLAATAGGTGFASYTIGDILYADTATTLAKLSDQATGKVLKSGGVGVAPNYGQVNLSTDVTGSLPESSLSFTDITTGNVSSTKHGFAPKSPAAATQFLNGAATPAFAQVKDSDLSVSDITTNNVTTSAHGFITKAPNDTAQFFRGDASWAVAFAQVCQGRLTLTTATPVTTADVTGATSIFFTPYMGNRVALYTSSLWKLYTFSEVTLALGTLTNDLPYDVFLFDSSGTLTLESVAWTSKTTRATALVLQDGVLVKSGSTNKRYLGTFHTTATTTTEDSAARRLLWNYYNRVQRAIKVVDTTDSWSGSGNVLRQVRGNSGNQIDCVIGFGEVPIDLTAILSGSNTSASTGQLTSIGEDSTSAAASGIISGITAPAASANGIYTARLCKFPAIGYHFYAWLEQSLAGATATFLGDAGGTSVQSGMVGFIFG